jgi:hypothetical protein
VSNILAEEHFFFAWTGRFDLSAGQRSPSYFLPDEILQRGCCREHQDVAPDRDQVKHHSKDIGAPPEAVKSSKG